MILATAPALALGLVPSALPSAAGHSPACAAEGPRAGETVELEYRSYRDWDIVLPAEQFARVSGELCATSCGGQHFKAELDGTALEVDTDGDGEPDTTVVGKEDDLGSKSALVTLRGTSEDGEPFTYTVRLVDDGKGWTFAAAGAMVGKIGATRVQLIDQNNDGDYDDYGVDAMIVGRGRYASFLSRAVNVAGELKRIEVSADGSRIDVTPFEGATGTLDLRSQLEAKGKLLAAVVKSADGAYSFDLARARAGLEVPAGTYVLHSAKLGLGKMEGFVRAGRMEPMVVGSGERFALEWGGPLQAEFTYQRRGATVQISPADVSYFGAAGEEYSVWEPVGKSPTFTILERDAGTELAKALFPGST